MMISVAQDVEPLSVWRERDRERVYVPVCVCVSGHHSRPSAVCLDSELQAIANSGIQFNLSKSNTCWIRTPPTHSSLIHSSHSTVYSLVCFSYYFANDAWISKSASSWERRKEKLFTDEVIRRSIQTLPLPLFIFNIHMKYLHVTCDVSVRYIPVCLATLRDRTLKVSRAIIRAELFQYLTATTVGWAAHKPLSTRFPCRPEHTPITSFSIALCCNYWYLNITTFVWLDEASIMRADKSLCAYRNSQKSA